MTPEEYFSTLTDTIYTNNRLLRDNQVLQARLLTMLENVYLANNPNVNHSTTNMFSNTNNTNTRQNRINNNANTTNVNANTTNNRLIQDYIFSYIFEPITNTTTTNTRRRQIPTIEQITNSTNSIIYDASNQEFTTHVCPITLTDFINGENLLSIRHCQHVFKESSLMNWFSRNSLCPLCRYDIRNYVGQGQEEEEEDDEPPSLEPMDDINNIYNIGRTSSTSSRTSRSPPQSGGGNSGNSLNPVIRNFASQMNISDTLTSEIGDIFAQLLNTNTNNTR